MRDHGVLAAARDLLRTPAHQLAVPSSFWMTGFLKTLKNLVSLVDVGADLAPHLAASSSCHHGAAHGDLALLLTSWISSLTHETTPSDGK